MNRNGKKVALSLVAIVLGAGFLMRVIPAETILGETGRNTVTIDGLPVPNSLLPDEEFQVAGKKGSFVDALSRDKVENRTPQTGDLWDSVPQSNGVVPLPVSFVQGGNPTGVEPKQHTNDPAQTGEDGVGSSWSDDGPGNAETLPPALTNAPKSPNSGGGSSGGGNSGGPSGDNGGSNGSPDNPRPDIPGASDTPKVPADEGPKVPDAETPPPFIPEEPAVGFPPVGPTDGPSVPPSIPDSEIPHSVPDSGNTLLLSLSSVSLLLACGKRFSRK